MNNPLAMIIVVIVLAMVLGRCDMQHAINQSGQPHTEGKP